MKDRERTITAALSYVLPEALCGERRTYAAERINSVPNRSTGNRTPFEIITGTKPLIPDYPFGQVGLFYHTTTTNNDMQSHADYGIVVGFNRDARNKYRVYFPFKNTILTRGAFQALEEPPAEWGVFDPPSRVNRPFLHLLCHYHCSRMLQHQSEMST
jgi:hypothetical protein